MSAGNLEKYGIPESMPPKRETDDSVPHAPFRPQILTQKEKRLAVENSLRYFPEKWHKELAADFLEELDSLGHIYMHLSLIHI